MSSVSSFGLTMIVFIRTLECPIPLSLLLDAPHLITRLGSLHESPVDEPHIYLCEINILSTRGLGDSPEPLQKEVLLSLRNLSELKYSQTSSEYPVLSCPPILAKTVPARLSITL